MHLAPETCGHTRVPGRAADIDDRWQVEGGGNRCKLEVTKMHHLSFLFYYWAQRDGIFPFIVAKWSARTYTHTYTHAHTSTHRQTYNR